MKGRVEERQRENERRKKERRLGRTEDKERRGEWNERR